MFHTLSKEKKIGKDLVMTLNNYKYSTYRKQLRHIENNWKYYLKTKSESEKLVCESKLHKVKD